MKDDRLGRKLQCPPGREGITGRVLAHGRDVVPAPPLGLQPQQRDDVGRGQDAVEVVADRRDWPALEGRRQQCGRGDQSHLGPQGGIRGDLGPGHPAVADVPHDGHPEPGEPVEAGLAATERLAHRVEVEQRLGGVLVPAVAGVDHYAAIDPLSNPSRHARRAVADDHRIHTDGLNGLDGVAQGLALLDRRRSGGKREHVGGHPLRRGLERHPGPGGVLEEQRGDGAAAQGRHLGIGPATDFGEGVRHPQDLADRLGVEVVHAEQMGREGAHRVTSSPRETPSSETSTISSRLVGRFFPT